MATAEGEFVWYELMSGDVDAAKVFYAQVVGWNMADSGMTTMAYALARIGERQVAGLTSFSPDAVETGTVMWFGYILVADVDVMAERVVQAGGAVHRSPTDIPGIGRFSVVADPQGAQFMLFRGSGDPAPDLPVNTPGTFGWHELHTTDWEAALAFYQNLFGWEKSQATDMGPMGTYQTFSIGGAWSGGMMNGGGSPEPHWLYYINVDDIGAAAVRVEEAGGKVQHGPLQVPGGNWVLMGTDPQGGSFALTQAAQV